MKKLWLTLVFFATCTPLPVFAESDPFELPHPVTGESGVWIPPWVQRLSLETEAKLKTCTDVSVEQVRKLAEKEAEVQSRVAVQTNLEAALTHTNTQLAIEQERVREAEASSDSFFVWALISTGGALIAGSILAIDAAF